MDNTRPYQTEVAQWDRYEIVLQGPRDGNPYTDVTLRAQFRHRNRLMDIDGFYDGEGLYRLRFMPDRPGIWTYRTISNRSELNGFAGEVICIQPAVGIHGPVRVRNVHHFAYDDGTLYVPIGTTCYAWLHHSGALEQQTLQTLRSAPFNKLRMCVFPTHYLYNDNEPEYYPFMGSPQHGWEYQRFNPAFFRHLEERVTDLLNLGIEADIILFHPYDRWGFAALGAANDDLYLRYIVARLASFRNVWWSLANEYDLVRAKSEQDWDRLFRIVQECDPYGHLRSIHNWYSPNRHLRGWQNFYDHSKPWVTHQSIQHHDLFLVTEWRKAYRKPVVVDECCYEGNLDQGWGNITAEEMTRRVWEGMARGAYVGHGETYLHPRNIIWWSHGGVLHGQSPARIAFLRQIVEEGPGQELTPFDWGWELGCTGVAGAYYLVYFGDTQPAIRRLPLPDDASFRIELIDTWNMTIDPLEETFRGECDVPLPGKPYVALRIMRAV